MTQTKYQKEWYEKNKERILKQKEAYRKKNKKIILEKAKEYNRRPEVKERKQKYQRKPEVRLKGKEYYKKNREKILQRKKEYYKNNPDKVNEWNKNNPDKYKKWQKEYYQEPEVKERRKEWHKTYYKLPNVKQRIKEYYRQPPYKEYKRKYHTNRKKADLNYWILCNLRGRISNAIKKNSKSKRTMKLIGCSVEYLKQHLETQFTLGMNWRNYGYGWHIDHMIPCSSFDLSKEDEQRKCFYYKNLQPLWALENIKKGGLKN